MRTYAHACTRIHKFTRTHKFTCIHTHAHTHRSPEVIAARPYNYASDVWSLGCVLYEMAARRPAFESLGLPQLMVRAYVHVCECL